MSQTVFTARFSAARLWQRRFSRPVWQNSPTLALHHRRLRAHSGPRWAGTQRFFGSRRLRVLLQCRAMNRHPSDQNFVSQFHYYCWDNPPRLAQYPTLPGGPGAIPVPGVGGRNRRKGRHPLLGHHRIIRSQQPGWSFWPWKKMATRNTPDSIKLPAPWAAVAAYARGGPQPARALAQQAFDELLINLRLENCVFFPGVVNNRARLVALTTVSFPAYNYGGSP